MRTFRFTPDVGHTVLAFGSHGVVLAPLLRGAALHVVAMHVEPGGVIARHPAADDQLFLVVAGSGRASGGDASHAEPVAAGTAVLWLQGEVHETRAGVDGLLAIVVEGPDLAELVGLGRGAASG